MNSTPQLDLHPDADSLNDFIEQALSMPEREQILAHLAACSRCRQVIYLAEKAAEEAPVLLTAARSTKPSGTWYGNWRLAWLPAAALAAALALVVTFYPRHTAPAPELTKVTPERKMTVPTPALPQPSEDVPHMPVPSVVAKSTDKATKLAPPSHAPSSEPVLLAAPTPSAEPGPIAFSYAENNTAQSPPTGSLHGVAQQQTPAQLKPETAVATWQQQQAMNAGTLSTNTYATQAIQMKMPAVNTPHTSRTSSFTAVAPRMAKQTAPTGSFDTSMQPPMARATASFATKSIHLPSGLTAISTSTSGHRTLAIDLAGALFFSDDTAPHWEQVPQQWTGRAIQVRVQSDLGGAIFKLTSDNGAVWMSDDGKTWTAR
ncbi:MAG: zf-HC2 domain-containing protein [Terracidiphilus sp.]|jgi:hypothetical protein